MSNDAAKAFDKSVLAAMLQVCVCVSVHVSVYVPVPVPVYVSVYACVYACVCTRECFLVPMLPRPQFQDMHRILEQKEAALIEAGA